jgi:hypothetical protein
MCRQRSGRGSQLSDRVGGQSRGYIHSDARCARHKNWHRQLLSLGARVAAFVSRKCRRLCGPFVNAVNHARSRARTHTHTHTHTTGCRGNGLMGRITADAVHRCNGRRERGPPWIQSGKFVMCGACISEFPLYPLSVERKRPEVETPSLGSCFDTPL